MSPHPTLRALQTESALEWFLVLCGCSSCMATTLSLPCWIHARFPSYFNFLTLVLILSQLGSLFMGKTSQFICERFLGIVCATLNAPPAFDTSILCNSKCSLTLHMIHSSFATQNAQLILDAFFLCNPECSPCI